MMAWLMHHRRAVVTTLAHMAATPVASLFTLLAIGIAISLPTGMYVLLNNATLIAGTLPAQNEITVFMRDDASRDDIAKVALQLEAMPGLFEYRFVSRQNALQTLSKQMGTPELAAELPKNPLPDAWIVIPMATDASVISQLASQLRLLPAVALVQSDHLWAQRLGALLVLIRQLIDMLAIILGVGLIAISGNTIRLQIITRHAEIEVSRLIGATARFIRRPFLYFGALQGLIGGLFAWGIVSLGIALLAPHVHLISKLYATPLALHPLDLWQGAVLLTIAGLLSWVGAYLAVGRALSQIEKSR